MSASFIKTVLFSIAFTACTANPNDLSDEEGPAHASNDVGGSRNVSGENDTSVAGFSGAAGNATNPSAGSGFAGSAGAGGAVSEEGGTSGVASAGSAGSDEEADPTWPRDACTCGLDLGAVEETGMYPNDRGDGLELIPGYGAYHDNCEIPSIGSEDGVVNLAFDCDPISSNTNPGQIVTTYYQRAWMSVRRTFVNLQDFSCCSSLDFDFRSSGYSLICKCNDDSYSTGCCFGPSTLTRRVLLRVTLVDVAAATTFGVSDEELWWYDFPEDTLEVSSEWHTLSVPIAEFVRAQGAGTGYNNDVLRLDLIKAVEVNVAITLAMSGGASCDSSGQCHLLDNYATAHITGDLSFRNMQTVCE